MSKYASSAAKTMPREKEERATNCNTDKARIEFLREAINKQLRNSNMTKKAAQIIEEMINTPSKTPNK